MWFEFWRKNVASSDSSKTTLDVKNIILGIRYETYYSLSKIRKGK